MLQDINVKIVAKLTILRNVVNFQNPRRIQNDEPENLKHILLQIKYCVFIVNFIGNSITLLCQTSVYTPSRLSAQPIYQMDGVMEDMSKSYPDPSSSMVKHTVLNLMFIGKSKLSSMESPATNSVTC